MSSFIDINNPLYPRLLKEIKDPPGRIYYKGNWSKGIFNNCLSVVGTRRITPYGKRVIKYLISGMQHSGITIVSGFMYGIDAYAHRSALESGLPTIAVMPCGIEVIHPSYQKDLYDQILDTGGLILSELGGGEPPQKWYFPKRNRIVAGLSKCLLIIEAAYESGSLITGNIASNNNRKVYSVPGSIFSQQSLGTNKIIGKYAIPALDSKCILDNYYERSYFPSKNAINAFHNSDNIINMLSIQIEKIIEILSSQSMTIDEISKYLNFDSEKANILIAQMCICGYIKEEGGKYYVC